MQELLRRGRDGQSGADEPSGGSPEDRAALGAVEDPLLFHRLDELGMLGGLRRSGRTPSVAATVKIPLAHYPHEAELGGRIARAVGVAPEEVDLELVVMDDEERVALAVRLRELTGGGPGVVGASGAAVPRAAVQGAGGRPNPFSARRARTRVLAVASGKGGVGKSTVTVNLAVALARAGHSIGLLDADIYGFSVPRMLGVEHPPMVIEKVIIPPVAHGVRCISMGFFVEEENAVAWRGPMLHKALEQFLVDVHWGAPEFLVVDMPPGTGDVALSIAQQLPGAELYVVTTPQPAAQRVAQRAGALARQLRLPLRGVVENMSWFAAPDGTRHELFGSGGGEALASSLGVPLLAQVPLDPAVREGADDGRPAVVVDPVGPVAAIFDQLAARIVEMGPARVYRSELSVSRS